MNILKLIGCVLVLGGFAFGVYRAVTEINISLSEKEPTKFDVENFAQSYKGQQWVEVRGYLALDRQDVRESTYEHHAGKGYYYVKVPLVGKDWRPSDPVHVVACYGPTTGPVGEQTQPAAIRGQVSPSGWDAGEIFPNLKLVEPAIWINEGTEPSGPAGMIAFLVICLIAIALALWQGIRTIRRMSGAGAL